ncbi:hypothetical protein INT46_007497 [Mucor plumbeus]|uniref:Uncharacterized protein n=1 Tax=Mucor plumbeus TaxID=97098 RepID=A0A8H7UWD7_9FUNG|nr:hypothetical protein INT46_007497 [Mucor plumbeus]
MWRLLHIIFAVVLVGKAVARARTNRIFNDKPELRGKTWPAIIKGKPLLRLQMVLCLEANLRTFQMHRCINSSASEKLLWESFRNKSTQYNAKLRRDAVRATNDVDGGEFNNFSFEHANNGISPEDVADVAIANVSVAGGPAEVASTGGDIAFNEETLDQFEYDFQDNNEYYNDSEEGNDYQYLEEESLKVEMDNHKDQVQFAIEDNE